MRQSNRKISLCSSFWSNDNTNTLEKQALRRSRRASVEEIMSILRVGFRLKSEDKKEVILGKAILGTYESRKLTTFVTRTLPTIAIAAQISKEAYYLATDTWKMLLHEKIRAPVTHSYNHFLYNHFVY